MREREKEREPIVLDHSVCIFKDSGVGGGKHVRGKCKTHLLRFQSTVERERKMSIPKAIN